MLKISDQNLKIDNFSQNFKQYLDVLDEIKKMKHNQIDAAFQRKQAVGEEFNENLEIRNTKFVRSIVSSTSNIISGKDLISNILTNKINENYYGRSSINRHKTILNDYLNLRGKEIENASNNGNSRRSRSGSINILDEIHKKAEQYLIFDNIKLNKSGFIDENEENKNKFYNKKLQSFPMKKETNSDLNRLVNAVRKHTMATTVIVYSYLK